MSTSLIRKFAGNTGWMLFKNIYTLLLSLTVGAISARFLGPSNYGLLDYGNAIIMFFTTVSKLGLDSVVIAEIVRKPEQESSYLGTALVLRLMVSVWSFFAIAGIVVVLEPDNRLLQVVTLLQATAIIFQSVEVLYFWFQARLEMKYVTLASIAALTAVGLWRILLLMKAADVKWFAFSNSVSAVVCGVCICVFFVWRARVPLHVSVANGRYILRHSYHFMINGLAVTLYSQLDRIMLGKMIDETAVGLYGVASALAIMWESIPNSLNNSANPLLIKLYDEDRDKFTSRYQMLFMGVTGMGVLISVAFSVLGRVVIRFLYGEAYLPAVPALTILSWSTCFAMIGSTETIWMIAAGKHKYAKYFTLIGAAINATLNVMWIPKWGFIGAAMATLVSQILVSMAAPMLFAETREVVKLYVRGFGKIPLFVREAVNILWKKQ